MKAKILLWSAVSILIIGIAVGAYWWMRRPQVIVLDNGDKLTLLGVTYGKHHAPPAVKTAADARRLQNGMAFNTPNNSLVVWIRQEHAANQWPNYQLFLYDKGGAACVGNTSRHSSYGGGSSNEIVGFQFDSFPRRLGKFILRVQEFIPNERHMFNDKHFVFNNKHFVISNPARGPFEKWTAELPPVTKTDDDLSVTLTKLESVADGNFNRDQDHPDDAINKGVEAVFHVQQNDTNTVNWQPVSVETSDATGNLQDAGCNSHWDGDNLVVDYQWGLWPGEPWKLRLGFSKQSDFDDTELLVVTNIPFQPAHQQDFQNWYRIWTNVPFVEKTVNGIRVKIYPAKQFTDQPPNAQPAAALMIRGDSMPEGAQLTLIKLGDQRGNNIDHWGWKSGVYGLRNIDGVTNLNVTIAIHKSHFFEFTAKPEKQ